jgi:hypothetical protein
MSKRPPRPNPGKVADQEVRELFESLVDGSELFEADPTCITDGAFDRVVDALKAERVREHGAFKDESDEEEVERYQLRHKAGYLIGVRVGMRLAGGVR